MTYSEDLINLYVQQIESLQKEVGLLQQRIAYLEATIEVFNNNYLNLEE